MKRLKQYLSGIFLFGYIALFGQTEKFTISGTISDSSNGESAIGAVAFIKGTTTGVSTNVYGFYSLTLPKGTYEISFSMLGYETQTIKIKLEKNIDLNPKLKTSSHTQLAEVVVTSDAKKEEIQNTLMSTINIPIEKIKNIPTIGGETDVIKVMQLMPGIKSGTEGQNGMYVRGGSGDDNLILLDEAVVYNVSHLFGFFSVFNNDALKDITVIKGGFPASYGGRLSSVMDIRMKEGDMEKYHVEGGIGLLSSRLTIQGPIKKNKASFIVSGRRSYIDQLFKKIYKQDVLPYYFYDVNAKVNWVISNKDRIYFSNYFGDDVLNAKTTSDTSFFDGGFKLGNFTTTMRWNHIYNARLFCNTTFIHTRFRYDVEASAPDNSFLVQSSIRDYGLKIDYNYYMNPRNKLSFGRGHILHFFRPNVVNTNGEISEFLQSSFGKRITTFESYMYMNNDQKLDSLFKLNYGLRLSSLNADSAFYPGFEPRLSGTYLVGPNSSIKASYARMRQYMHLVSSSSFALPTDLWYPVTKNVKPQTSDQIALGYSRNFNKLKSIFTVEAYYKWLHNLIEYREGAVLILNDNYEKELIRGKGKAYGLEFFFNRTEGKISGWIGYTLSWSTRHFDDLNNGKMFFAKYDRRHDISVVFTWDITKRCTFSAVWITATGTRITAPIGQYIVPNASLTGVDVLTHYSDRNSIILPPTRRLDLSIILKTKTTRAKWLGKGEWHFSVYNFFNRTQPYQIRVSPNTDGTYHYESYGWFGFIPSIAWNFKF